MTRPWMADIAATVRQRVEREGIRIDGEAAEQFRALAAPWVEGAIRDDPRAPEASLLRIGVSDDLLRQRSDEIRNALVRRTLIRMFQEELDKRALAGTLNYELDSDEEPVSSQCRTD